MNVAERVLEVYRDPRGGRYRSLQTLEATADVEVEAAPALGPIPVRELLP